MYFLQIKYHFGVQSSLIPRPIPSFSMLHATLKNWEEPGNKASAKSISLCHQTTVADVLFLFFSELGTSTVNLTKRPRTDWVPS